QVRTPPNFLKLQPQAETEGAGRLLGGRGAEGGPRQYVLLHLVRGPQQVEALGDGAEARAAHVDSLLRTGVEGERVREARAAVRDGPHRLRALSEGGGVHEPRERLPVLIADNRPQPGSEPAAAVPGGDL